MSFTPSEDQSVAIQINAEDNASGAFAAAESSALDMKQAVAGAGAVLAGAGVAGLAGAASAAADFESAMVEVEKVTNPETAAAMSGSIRELSETIPLAQKELAGIAADAGRFGVEGPENIRKFTESTAKMASATNLNTEQAGQAFAKLTELTGTPISEVENLGSAINELSNNSATSAQEITEAMMRSAGALSQLGMSQTEIAGMSAALNEVSESSERAGTRLRRLGQEMMNPKKTEDIAAALGMTVSEFKTMREESPDEVMLKMAKAMGEGDKQADALKNTLSTTSRQALTGLAQNLDGTREALEMSGKAYKENTSVQKEFAASSDTFNKKLQTLRNRFRNVAIVVGNQILPVLIKAIDRVTPLIDRFAEVNAKLDGLPVIIAAVGAALTGLGAVAVSVGPAIVGALSPVLVPVAAITAAVGALYYAWTNNMGGIQEATTQMLATVKPAISAVERIARQVFEQYVMPMLGRLRATWASEFQTIMNDVTRTMSVVEGYITTTLSFLETFWGNHGADIMAIVKQYFGAVELVVTTIMRGISATIRTILALIRGDFDGALSIILSFWKGTFNDVLAFLAEDWMPGMRATFNAFFGFVKQLFTAIYEFLIGGSIIPKTFNAIEQFITDSLRRLVTSFSDFFEKLSALWQNGLAGLAEWLSTAGASVFTNAFEGVANAVYDVIDAIVRYIKGGIRDATDWMLDAVSQAVDDVVSRFNSAVPSVLEIPSVTVGGGSLDIPSATIENPIGDDWTVGGGDLDIPSESIGGVSMDIPQLATGGIITDDTLARVGEAGQSEAVVPLQKLSRYLDTAYEVGANTVSPSATGGTQRTESALTATLRVDGDGDLADLIREHAELVVEERDASKRARIARK